MDDDIVNGSWHKCECGRNWSDADGGPCHTRCIICDRLFEEGIDDTCAECSAMEIEEVEKYSGECK